MVLQSLLLALSSFGHDDTIAFAHAWGSLQVGGISTVGSLYDDYPLSPRLGATLRFSHWNAVRSRLDLAYTRFSGTVPLHFLFGAAGFDWSLPRIPLELGASLGLFYVRSFPDSIPHLNDDGETEFGASVRVTVPLWNREPWSLYAFAQYDRAWTLPHATVLPGLGLGLEHRLW